MILEILKKKVIIMINNYTYLLETPYWLLQNSSIVNKYPFAKKYESVNEINQIGIRYSGKTISNIKMFVELLKISLLIKGPICISSPVCIVVKI